MTNTIWSATLVSDFSSFATVAEQIELLFESPKSIMNATLACDEAFTNVVMYSGATAIDVEIFEQDDDIVVRISDNGTPFDPVKAKPIERDFEDLDQGGMGIKIIKKACSKVEYAYVDDKNTLTLHFEMPTS